MVVRNYHKLLSYAFVTTQRTRRKISTSRNLLLGVNDDDKFKDIRQSARSLCAKFPGPYWQELDKNDQ